MIEMVLIIPKGHKLNHTMRFEFKASNNIAEYEALLVGLRLAQKMQVKRLLVNSNHQRGMSQVNGNFTIGKTIWLHT